MKRLIITFIAVHLLFGVSITQANETATSEDKLYPNRKFYPQLSYISTEQMITAVKDEAYNVIDARPVIGYQTLHIKGADNFSAGDKDFTEKLLELINKNNKPLVFYCGGLACLKSYKASDKAIRLLKKRKVKRYVYTYDSGISTFAYASPDLVLKNGKEVSEENPLLDMEKLKKHAKNVEEFISMVGNDSEKKNIILDIREYNQHILRKIFTFKKEKKLTLLEPEKMIVFLNKVKESGKILMMYGSVEKQVESFYYLIKGIGIKKWYYLEGGEKAYSQYMVQKHITN